MKAVVEVKGKQYIVEVGARIRVDLIDSVKGTEVKLPILLTMDERNTFRPSKEQLATMDGSKNSAKSGAFANAIVITHGLAKKIRVFKHHAKKRYRRTQGHRQGFTELEIQTIGVLK